VIVKVLRNSGKSMLKLNTHYCRSGNNYSPFKGMTPIHHIMPPLIVKWLVTSAYFRTGQRPNPDKTKKITIYIIFCDNFTLTTSGFQGRYHLAVKLVSVVQLVVTSSIMQTVMSSSPDERKISYLFTASAMTTS